MEITIEKLETSLRRVLATNCNTPWHDTDGAAAYLSCSPGTLKTWRARGEGPRYHVINEKSVRYHVDELDAFVRGEVAR